MDAEAKICNKCHREKELSLFVRSSSIRSGYASWCKECLRKHMAVYRKSKIGGDKHRAYARKYRFDNKMRLHAEYLKGREFINSLKAGPCMDCGIKFPSYVMHFDHVPGRGEKLWSLSYMSRFSLKKIMIEMKKCDLVCANCHAIRTHERRAQS